VWLCEHGDTKIRCTSTYYIPSVSTYNLCRLQQPCAPARNKGMYSPLVPIWILYFQPLVHFFNNLLVITVEPLPRDGISQGSREVMGLVSSRLYGGWGRIVFMSRVIASCDFKLCGHTLSCWRRISANFYEWVWMLLTWWCVVLGDTVYRSELMVWPWGIMSTRITSSPSQKIVAMIILLKGWP
jgi:hypothetical protein